MGSQEILDLKDKKEHDRPLERVLFTCFMYNDGDGDVGHFADLCNPAILKEALPKNREFEISRLMLCPRARAKIVQEKLREKNITDTHVVYYDRDFIPSKDSEHTFGLKELQEYLERNPSLKEKISNLTMIVNAPTGQMMYLLDGIYVTFKNNPVILSINQHGGISTHASHQNDMNHRYMGFATAHHGIILHPKPKLDKASSFLNIDDEFFMNKLLQCNMEDKKQAEEYLSRTLLIPLSQYREGPRAFGVILSAVVASEIIQTSNYKELVFIVGKDNINEDCMDFDFLQSNHVSEIEYIICKGSNNAKSKQIKFKADASKKNIKIKIIENYRLNNKNYNDLFNAAQIFCGSSGDKSFEAAIENGLISLIQPLPYKNRVNKNFFYTLEKFLPYEAVQGFYDFSLVCREVLTKHKNTVLAKRIAKALNNQVLKSWNLIIEEMYKDYNFYDVYPQILEQAIIQSHLNRFSKNMSSSEVENLNRRLLQLNSSINKRSQKEIDALISRVVKRSEIPEVKDKKDTKEINSSNESFVFSDNNVNVSAKFFSDEELHIIFNKLNKDYRITLLDLSDNGKLSQETWQSIFKTIMINTALRKVISSANKMNDKQFSSLLQSLKGNTALTYLDLAFNEINNLKPLIEFLPNSQLVEIDLTGNIGVGDDSAQALAAILPKLSLRRINLTGTNVSHKGVQFLQEASKLCDFPIMVIVDNVNVTKQQASGTYLTTHSTAGAEQPKPIGKPG